MDRYRDREDSRRFICYTSMKHCRLHGSCIPLSGPLESNLVHACVHHLPQIEFNPIPEHVIEALIEEGEVFWCAGALMCEHALVAPYIVAMHGTLDAVMGLDKALTISLLHKLVED